MVIKRDTPRSARLLLYFLLIGLVASIALLSFDLGRRFSQQTAVLVPQAAAPVPEVVPLQAILESEPVAGAESQLTILRSAQEQLVSQVKALEIENTRLKEDLAFFESFLPATGGKQGVAVQNLTAELVEPNQVRYRLLVMRNGRSDGDFTGQLEIAVSLLQSGKAATITFPEKGVADTEKFDLKFKYYQRVEGVLTLPDDAVIKTIQARVLDKGRVKAQQSVNL
jgi:hypothetical protein